MNLICLKSCSCIRCSVSYSFKIFSPKSVWSRVICPPPRPHPQTDRTLASQELCSVVGGGNTAQMRATAASRANVTVHSHFTGFFLFARKKTCKCTLTFGGDARHPWRKSICSDNTAGLSSTFWQYWHCRLHSFNAPWASQLNVDAS